MMLTSSDYRESNEALYEQIQKIYDKYFKPEEEYKQGSFGYSNAPDYGYVDFERREFYGQRVMNAEEYVQYSGTHCTHMVIPEPYNTKFFDGLRQAVLTAGDRIVFKDTYVLYLTKKPQA